MDLYKRLLRPVLFSLPPETAHTLGHAGLHVPLFWKLAQPLVEHKSPRLHVSLGGITLSNPVGLAAGWDKNCRAIGALRRLGFGYIVGGTVTPEPRSGNPRPRVVRDPAREAAINSLGFPNQGMERVARWLRRSMPGPDGAPLFVSIAGSNIQGFVSCLEALQPLADGIEVNISSPNTAGLRVFHDPDTFERLLAELVRHWTKPLFVKMPPYTTPAERDNVHQLVRLCRAHDVAGVTVSNTLPVQEPRLAVGAGGLSGKPLLANTLHTVRQVRALAGEGMVIHASGGIFDGADALAALQHGADTVQVMSALWYRGPAVARHINRWLDRYMQREGLTSLRDLRREVGEASESDSGASISA